MAFNHNFFLLDGQRLAGCDAQLLFNQVDAGDHFGYRVFNLNTGVHFDEIELAVFEQELKSTPRRDSRYRRTLWSNARRYSDAVPA